MEDPYRIGTILFDLIQQCEEVEPEAVGKGLARNLHFPH